MATVTKPIALDESFNTTEVTPRNIADVLAEGLSHITGRTASEVEYDNTDSGLTANNVQDALDEINGKIPTVPSVDIQTAVDEFETYNGGILSSLKVSLSPNQDLHGYDSPWVGGAGKNKLPMTLANIIALNTDGTWNGNSYSISGMTFDVITDDANNVTSIKINGHSTNVIFFRIITISEINSILNGSYIANGCPSGGSINDYYFAIGGSGNDYGSGVNISTPLSGTNVIFRVENGKTLNNIIFTPMIRLATESDPTFEPYENICPISGHTQVDVRDGGKNLFNPTDIISGKRLTNITGTAYNSTQDVIAESNSFVSSLIKVTQGNVVTKNSPNENAYHRWHIYDGNGICVRYTSDNVITINSGESYVALCGVNSEINTTQIRQGYQVTVNLGGTYYSGTLDVVTGVFVPDTAFKTFDGSEGWSANGTTGYLITRGASGMSDVKLASSANTYCLSNLIPRSGVTWADKSIGIENGTVWIGDVDNAVFGDLAGFKTFLSNTNLQLEYELATPTPIQLSPTMVKALVGENHLSAPLEGQEITESKYKQMFTFDDVNTQIESTYSEGISHNSVYRGKYLGDHVTDEQWDAIGDGSFRDLYIGDYWAINGINWRIAHFNYWLGTGDVKCNTNHVVIVPYGWVSTFNMNATDDTTGGYLNSEWYTTNRHFAVENIEADFGASHILSHRNFFSDAVSDGHASHGMWVDSTVDLMNEIMVCGSLVGSYSGKYYEVGCDKFQLALFKYNPPSTRMDVSYWLRGVSTASSFVAMGNFGLLDGFTASQILKIRPVFAIKK